MKHFDKHPSFSRSPLTPVRHIPAPSEPRLTVRLGLEYPYDFANPSMDAERLILQVVRQYRFNDMLKIAYYFGVDVLKEGAYIAFGHDQPKRLKQVIRNIELGANLSAPQKLSAD